MERSVGPDIPTSSETIHARSCQKCNQRKTRCSRTLPCTSCVKLGVECIFPPPGRAPRKRKRALKAELVSRVKYLEHRLHDLGADPKPQAIQTQKTRPQSATLSFPWYLKKARGLQLQRMTLLGS
ncbi:unnamed protein product [Penicillium salamii]|nr:unnamed protein product [Penicillium salamii]CAG8366520.1 unnamed protein product [Penicillium salamii]